MNEKIPAETVPGWIALRVPDLERSLKFYQGLLGLEAQQQGRKVVLSPVGGEALIVLEEKAGLRPSLANRPTTGLYHMAILLPSRPDLARALRHLVETGWPLQGAADHLVSEALYLADPDGNGIEIYRDRPRAEWPQRDGRLQMATEALDARGLMSEIQGEGEDWSGLPSGTRLGHVHLRVASIPDSQTFYCDVLGFDLVTSYGPSAAFVSAGGYHHHIGFNTWESAGAPAAQPDTVGMDYFSLLLPDQAGLEGVATRLGSSGVELQHFDTGYLVRDPSQNAILLTRRQKT